MPGVVEVPVETLPEVPPAVKPVPVQEVALVDDHVSVADCPRSMVEGFTESVAVGGNTLQLVGLLAPLIHTSEPSEFVELPPVPVHPPLLHATQDEEIYARPFGHCVQVGGLFAPFAQTPEHVAGSLPETP